MRVGGRLALSLVEGLALSLVEGLALSLIEGLALSLEGLDLGCDVEVGHHRVLFAAAEQRAIPAVGHDLFRQPGVRNDGKAHVRKVRGLMREHTEIVVARRARAELQLVDDSASQAASAMFLADDERADFGK